MHFNGSVPRTSLYIAAYDIRSPKRLSRMLRILKKYSTGGQKSVFECFLTSHDRKLLLEEVGQELDAEHDSFLLLRLDPRAKIVAMGRAIPASLPDYFVVG